MSSIQCCVSECKLRPEYLCSCTNPKSALCITHLNNHGDPGVISHPFENIFCRPLENTKISLLARLRQEKTKINAMKQKFILDDSKNIKNIVDGLKNKNNALASGIKTIDYYIVTIMNAAEVDRNSDDSLLKLLLLSSSEALLQIDQVIKDIIDFGSIADNCYFNERQDEANACSLETIEKINKLEIEVKELREEVISLRELKEEVKSLRELKEEVKSLRELKEEVKSLREIIDSQAIHQSSSIEKPKIIENSEESKEIASVVKDLNQELQIQIPSCSASKPLNSQVPQKKSDIPLLNSPIILKPPKHGLRDFGNSSFINSVLQVLSSFTIFVEITIDSDDYLLKTLNFLLLSMKNPSEQAKIDTLLLKTITALSQEYPIINQNKDPRLLLELILLRFMEVYPGDNLFTVVKHEKIVCSLGHINENDSSESIVNIPDLASGQIKDAIDSLKAPKVLTMDCSICNKAQECTISIPSIDLPCFLIISFCAKSDFVLPEMFCYEDSSYELFGAINKVKNLGIFDKYVALTKDDGSWSKYDNKVAECCNIDFKGCCLAFYMNV